MLRRGKNESKLYFVVETLVHEGLLSAKFRPHKLTGEWGDFLECHIEPDWLLIYSVNDKEVSLVRTGTHSDLFE